MWLYLVLFNFGEMVVMLHYFANPVPITVSCTHSLNPLYFLCVFVTLTAFQAKSETVATTWYDGTPTTVDVTPSDSFLTPSKSALVEYPEWDFNSQYVLAFYESEVERNEEQVKKSWDLHSTIALGSAANLALGVGSVKANAGMMVANMLIDDPAI